MFDASARHYGIELEFGSENKNVVTAQKLMRYVGAEPFRPFRISMASGQSFDITHPEMVSVGRSKAHIDFFMSDDAEQIKERVREVSLLLMESIEPLEAITSERRD